MSETKTTAEHHERDTAGAGGAEPSVVEGTEAKRQIVNGSRTSNRDVEAASEAPKSTEAPGNPFQIKRGLIAILAGGIPAFLLMAKNGQHDWGVPLGLVFIAICAFGVMDLLGTFDDDDSSVVTSLSVVHLIGPLGLVGALGVAFAASLTLAQNAAIPTWLACAAVPASFIGLVAAVFKFGVRLGPWKRDELGNERPLLSRHGFWVVVLGAMLYLPVLGIFSLWDPWETHYGEVAREILARDDWVSLWWAQDGWFWSKPILNFWIQALAMGSLGTHFQPDQMLIAANGTAAAHPEWVVRTPNVLMTIGAMYLLYKGVAKVFGRRAGLLGAIVLATMPDWFFLAHQTMTDMPFVAAMTAAMGLLLLGLNTDEETRLRTYEVTALGRKVRVSLWHLVFGAMLLCALPQILYLLSRNIELVVFGEGPKGFHPHWDQFRSGSAGGNCGLPGNENCATHSPAAVAKGDAWWAASKQGPLVGGILHLVLAFEPAMQAILWSVVLGGILYLNWGERRARRLFYVAAWICAAVATMAKGPAGFGLPIICAFAYVATKKRWTELLRFELVSGLLIILVVALPWYVAMYVRHGSPFTDRLIFHDMFNRAFSHVHDTNEGDDTGIRYYVWQLGYASFPWTGLVPLGLLWGFRRSDSATARHGSAAVGDTSVMLVMWFVFAFALFTFMGTKFHHYIFPAVPPAAMLVGIALDDMLGIGKLARRKKQLAYYVSLAIGVAITVYGATRLRPGNMLGAKPVADAIGAPELAVPIIVVGMAIAAASFILFGSGDRRLAPSPTAKPSAEETSRVAHEQLMLGAAAFAGALATILVGLDLSAKAEGGEPAGAIRLLQLFTYNYKRPWPDTLDFSGALTAFTVVAGLVGLGLMLRSWRRHAVVAACAFGILWAAWGLDVYMFATSPHWGQHEVIEAYYRDRKGPDEQLVAYQMNWKGENIYTGNRIPAFVSTGATFTNWMKKEREKGTRVMYFVTEHSRISGLRNEVGAKAYRELTDKALCNKFVLVRAEL